MTVEEKRKAVQKYCSSMGVYCEKCVLSGSDWTHKCKGIGGIKDCLHIKAASEEELDEALRLIGVSTGAELYESSTGAVSLVRVAEGIKSEGMVLQLEVKDISPMQIAYAICNFYVEGYHSQENALLNLDELTEHIDAYVRAERKALEYKKLAEEG